MQNEKQPAMPEDEITPEGVRRTLRLYSEEEWEWLLKRADLVISLLCKKAAEAKEQAEVNALMLAGGAVRLLKERARDRVKKAKEAEAIYRDKQRLDLESYMRQREELVLMAHELDALRAKVSALTKPTPP